ncbi:competence/damage-inducible CinA C-terminal domain protein [Orientia chuto str. Dubai]|uniref:Competence/damage-inducible CinA C-terminal domain protein n=1 Tax=Orientia chuto str. Dubai TaxID=1359168 RepID=A0A0F3MK81_9RICK|nr:CinA family protein [Candidatus Orientia mediorientalis]KJV56178.1 competence/damage-inducible CinA C-terminal domain protein [Orientia chuto str. Dubai]
MQLDDTIIAQVNEIYNFLISNNKDLLISTAESCTGGMLAAYITSVSGASQIFQSGIIVYSNISKVKLLKLPQYILSTYGSVSAECAIAMAENCKIIMGSDIAISITGNAGPSTEQDQVGLVYFGVCATSSKSYKRNFNGDRNQIRNQMCQCALELLRNYLYCYNDL